MKNISLPCHETIGGEIHDAEGKVVVKGIAGRFKVLPNVVNACNAHDELLAVVKAWDSWIERQSANIQSSAMGLYSMTQSAISKAGGK